MTTTSATLLERIRNGDDLLAWDEFFGRYWPAIYHFARRRGCSEHTSEEIVQDVMFKIFRSDDACRHDPSRGRFRDWLGAVVRNQVAEQRRRPADRVHGKGGASDAAALAEPDAGTTPEEDWDAAFESNLLAVLLDAVRRESAARTYLAFELVAVKGLSGDEASRITGLSRNAVYKAHRRVLERLVELGAPYRDDGQLTERIKQAIDDRPSPVTERSLTDAVHETMSRQ
jgi:RNA polymerase sigma factor (sigma-70 family)